MIEAVRFAYAQAEKDNEAIMQVVAKRQSKDNKMTPDILQEANELYARYKVLRHYLAPAMLPYMIQESAPYIIPFCITVASHKFSLPLEDYESMHTILCNRLRKMHQKLLDYGVKLEPLEIPVPKKPAVMPIYTN